MFKKRLAFMMVLVMLLSICIQTAFALEPASNFKNSDRYMDIDPEGEELGKAQNPFGAIYGCLKQLI